MSIAVISFTGSGRKLSERIAEKIPDAKRFCFHKHTDENAESFTEISVLIESVFGEYDAFVFVSSVGIAVRAVASHLISKVTDPAVVAVDDSGKFAVSVLSGHLGGANELAEKIAAIIGAVPVITTATDSHGLFSPDMFAKKNGLVICDMNAAKTAAAMIVNGYKVGFRCCYPHTDLPDELTENEGCKVGICISDNADDKPFETTLNLLPKNLIAGIGCKKGTLNTSITTRVMSVFSVNDLDIRRLAGVATIDLKAEEPGLLEFCESFGLPLKSFSAEELMNVPGDFSHSDFVARTTGSDNVCERAAVCAGGSLIVRKTAGIGVTVAVAELPVRIVF